MPHLRLTRPVVPWNRTGNAPPAAGARIRRGRSVAIALTAVLLLFTALEFDAVWRGQVARGWIGGDLAVYLAVARRWIETGALFAPSQLAGPYTNVSAWLPDGVENLYPPPAVLLFVPFLVLPAILWWAIPLGIIVAGVIYWKPAWWSWPVLAALLVPVQFSAGISTGNTTIWVVAALMLATRWPAAAILLALKPSFFLFALPFARHRSWWLAALVLGLGSLLFLPSWPSWWRASQNFDGNAAALPLGSVLLYGWTAIPLLLVPFVVRGAARRSRAALT